ncbi:transporter substrate-binding domain-containing protein [Algihabitans albus]|uniref:transporter substrate-binding domain-containing protein n=1 Tax=Algihabitans albus TaxID=2164067 RepID=UPI000E5C94E2|nr:transporter substrate-binding domain-containing protein [Algihabitans albus]
MPSRALLPVIWFWLLAICLAGPAAANDLDDVLERGTLRVGTALFSPWAMRAEDGALIGFEAEVAAKLAQDMGVELETAVMAFDQLIPALEEGAIDMIAAGLSITPRRALVISFSQPYATSGINMLVNRELGETLGNLSDFNDPSARIAVVRDTAASDVARSLFPEAEIFLLANEEEVATAVLTKRVLAAVATTPFPELRRLAQPNRVFVPFEQPLVTTGEGFGLSRGAYDLKAYLDSWIVFRSLDGWLGDRRDYWFGTLAWQSQLPPEERITRESQ